MWVLGHIFCAFACIGHLSVCSVLLASLARAVLRACGRGGAGRYKILCFNQAILGYSTKWAQVKTAAALRRRNLSCNLDYFAKGGGKSKKKRTKSTFY